METACKLGPPEFRVSVSHSVVSDPLQPHGLKFARLLWDSPGKNTGGGCHSLLQGIFPTQGSNSRLCLLCLLHWQLVSEPPGNPAFSLFHGNFFSLSLFFYPFSLAFFFSFTFLTFLVLYSLLPASPTFPTSLFGFRISAHHCLILCLLL